MVDHWLGTEAPLRTHHERPKGMGLHICAVVRERGAGLSGEHVEIVNDGAQPVTVTGLELTDLRDEQHDHRLVYAFPQGELGAGVTAYVYSGSGTSRRTPHGDLILYAGLSAPVWRDETHVAQLRHPDGRIIDTLRTGKPVRHPDGH